jgi:hypothetical protein
MRDSMEQWGRDLRHAARSLRRAPGFGRGDPRHAGARHRRQRGDLQRRRRRADPAAALRARRSSAVPGRDGAGIGSAARVRLFDEGFVHYRERSRLLEDLAFYNSFTSTLRVGDRVERVRMSSPTYTLFSTLGATPQLGRLPVAEDEGASR